MRFAGTWVAAWTCLAGMGLLAAAASPSDPGTWESFDGPSIGWTPAGGDARYRLVQHVRSTDRPHSGAACERITLVAGNGTAIYLSHPVSAARLIGELRIRLWVRSDRPGVRLLARVVLPRTIDPRTGSPLTTLLSGPAVSRPGEWEPLELVHLTAQLEQRVRALRVERGPQIDPREAYVDQVWLNVYTGMGPSRLSIDDLVVAAAVPPERHTGPSLAMASVTSGGGEADGRQVKGPSQHDLPLEVRFRGQVLQLQGRPALPRVVPYRGERLEQLKELGFNLVHLPQLPSDELIRQAQAAGVGLICPPPRPDQWPSGRPLPPLEAVVAWDLGDWLVGSQLDGTRRWARFVRHLDPNPDRPLIGAAKTDLRGYSRHVNILIADRNPLGTSLPIDDYATWLAEQPLLALPGTPFWSRIATQRPAELLTQQRALAGPDSLAGQAEWEHIQLLCATALVAGARGLLFDSPSPLNENRPGDGPRTAALQLVNLQLALIEPWVAAGSQILPVSSSQPAVAGALLCSESERARLLVPVRVGPAMQLVPPPAVGQPLTLLLPGVPETNDVFELSPGGLRRLNHKRVAGGVRVALEQVDGLSMLLVTQDPLVLSSVTQRLQSVQPRAAELLETLAAAKWRSVASVSRSLSDLRAVGSPYGEALARARSELQACSGLRAAGDHRGAFDKARGVLAVLGRIQHAQWHEALADWPSPVASPLAVQYETLPAHLILAKRLARARFGPNLLTGGDCEDLSVMRDAGWRHFQGPSRSVAADVVLAPHTPHGGSYCLRLRAESTGGGPPGEWLEAAPVWVVSPPVPVESDQVVRIHGWIRMEQPVRATVDGLLIVDSLGGEGLAQRVGPQPGWQEFTLYRATAGAKALRMTFALTGLGVADVDDLTVQPVELGP